jgi:hypothetical protein
MFFMCDQADNQNGCESFEDSAHAYCRYRGFSLQEEGTLGRTARYKATECGLVVLLIRRRLMP